MKDSTLYDYTLELYDYVVGQIRGELSLHRIPEIPAMPSDERLRYDAFHQQTLDVWLWRSVRRLDSKLAEYILQDRSGIEEMLPLNDRELFVLECLASDPPMRCDAKTNSLGLLMKDCIVVQ